MSRQPTARSRRVLELIATLSLEEKLAQLVGLWPRMSTEDGAAVAPLQDSARTGTGTFENFARHGLGQLTRPYGTVPVDPAAGAADLARHQRWLLEHTRAGIPALVHEECLTGVAAWRATTYPTPLAWGASFDPELVGRMGEAIGTSLRSLGVHQGLAPVLDVVRDARWGRVEECIGEDPYLVGTIATEYVRGLQGTGVIATLKHLVGYSNSRAGRNLAPVHAGAREVNDVLLFPFEMAVLDGGAGSVMNSYTEIDGVPVAADASLLTTLLRDDWHFEGTVVADYFSVAFLQSLHGVAGDLSEAAAQAITAGIDVELPTGEAYLEPLAAAVRSGRVPEMIIDRALDRVLSQKAELGLLDEGYVPELAGPFDLDPPESRLLARTLAEESVILLQNDLTLPLGDSQQIAVIGPNADNQNGLFGCYAFANHVLPQHPETELGLLAPTVLEALSTEFGPERIRHAVGCTINTDDHGLIAAAAELASDSDVAVVVVGDRAGLFGRGTSGEGCDTETLELPGIQRTLVEAVLATGTPTILVLLTGRPYAIDWAVDRAAAILQAFFPGEEGASAVAGVLSGRVNPSGRLPVSMPRSAGAQPYSYLRPRLGGPTGVSNLDPTPVFSFGHGLSFTTFGYSDLRVADGEVTTDGAIVVSVQVRNEGHRAGAEVVQLYGRGPISTVTRPVIQLLGYARIHLEPQESAEVTFDVPTRLLAISNREMIKVVDPGRVELIVGRSAGAPELTSSVELIGDVHPVRIDERRITQVKTASNQRAK